MWTLFDYVIDKHLRDGIRQVWGKSAFSTGLLHVQSSIYCRECLRVYKKHTQKGLIGYFILDIDNTIILILILIYYNLLCLSSTNNPRDEGRPADTSPVTNRLHVENDWRDPAGRINCALFVVYCLDIIYTLFKFKSSTSLVSFH